MTHLITARNRLRDAPLHFSLWNLGLPGLRAIGDFWLLIAFGFVLHPGLHAQGEQEFRSWTSKQGKAIEASLVNFADGSVSLKRKADGKQMTVKIDQLSPADQTYLAELQKKSPPSVVGATTIEGIDATPGKECGPISCANGKWSYYLYLPKTFHTGKKWPIWFIMNPSGGSGGAGMNRYIEGADRLDCILAISVESKNSFDESIEAINTMVDDVFNRLPVNKSLGFSTGMSGGSRQAYLLAEGDKRIAGVLACGSGSGVYPSTNNKDFRDAKLRSSTFVYSLIGTNCFNRSEATQSHQKFPNSFRLRFFPGGHDWAESTFIAPGMARVLGEALAHSKSKNSTELDADRNAYAQAMLAWITEMAEQEPWEAALLADFLSTFPATGDTAMKSKALAADLKRNPRVVQAAEAEKAILSFTRKHFKEFGGPAQGKLTDPKREAEAVKIATKFEGLPHAEIITKLGEPTT